MMKENNFAFESRYGIVYISNKAITKKRIMYTIIDSLGMVHNVLDKSIVEISSGFIDNIKNKTFEKKINKNILKKGEYLNNSEHRILFNFDNYPDIITVFFDNNLHYLFLYNNNFDLHFDSSKNEKSILEQRIAACYYLYNQIIKLYKNVPALISKNSDLNEDEILRLFDKYIYTNDRNLDIISGMKILSIFAEDKKYSYLFAKFLDIHAHNHYDYQLFNEIKKYIKEKTFFNEYLNQYLKNTYYTYSYEIEISDSTVINNTILEYFKPEYNIFKENKKIFLYYCLKSPAGYIALNILEKNNNKFVIENIKDENSTITEMAISTVNYINSKYGENIKREKAKLKAKIDEEIKEEKLRILNHNIELLCSELNKNKLILSDNKKAELEFIFTVFDTFNNNYFQNIPGCIEIKIGIQKKYVVKNILNFADYFSKGETIKYGKGFSFTHIIDNIKDSQKDTLKLILMCASGFNNYDLYYGNKALPLNGANIDGIFSSLKGQTVIINKENVFMSLNKVNYSIKMNKDFILEIMIPTEEYSLFNSDDICYLLDHSNKRLDILCTESDEISLLKFIELNDGVSMKPVAERFRDEIYSRFYEKFELSENIKKTIHLSPLQINGYFDYENSKITVKSDFYKDDTKVENFEILSSLDNKKKDSYYEYLADLGFIDNVMSNDGDIINFFSMNMNKLKKHCNVFLSDSIQNKSVHNFRTQIVKIQLKNNIMEAFLEDSDYSDKELKMIISSIRHKKKYVLLSSERIINLDMPEADEFEKTVSDLGMNVNRLNQPVQIPVIQALRAFAHEKGCKIDSYLYNMIDDIKKFKKADITLPKINATLRSYQEEGFKWMKILSNYHVGGILADDMGLGKTLEVITLVASDEEQSPSLVVCPKSVVFNWINEFKRFSPDTNVIDVYGNAAQRHEIIESVDKNKKVCFITSYDSLKNDEEYYNFNLNYLILDEAQYIKNVNAQKSKCVKALKANHKFALTGTPIENNVIDLWSIFDFIMPGYLEDLVDFKKAYSGNDNSNEIISRKIAPFILRRTKKEVLNDLPDKYERIVTAEMIPEQRKIYDAYKLEAKEALDTGKGAFDILPYLMRLRQICDDPGLFIENYDNGSGKINLLSQILDEYLNEGHRILIFSQFVKAIDLISAMLNKKGINYFRITGDTSAQDRINYMNKFNEEKYADVFLISLKSGGTGLNLIGADTVIHFDPWWNVAAEDQASDRAHRIGQTKNVEVIKLICENSVEQKVIELQNIKKDLIDKLISDNDKSVTGISVDDIKFILKN